MTNAAPRDFSHAAYLGLLQAFRDGGYHFTNFEKAATELPDGAVILRHDVDRSTSKARMMAKKEAELGVRSTYFIRMHSNYYNPFGFMAYRDIRAILDCGHSIGLHTEFFDAAQIFGEDQIGIFRRECAAFEAVTGQKVKIIAPHRTIGSTLIEDQQKVIERIRGELGIPCAYDPQFNTPRYKYLSESSGFWREGWPGEQIGKHKAFQLLVHPEWWYETYPQLEEDIL